MKRRDRKAKEDRRPILDRVRCASAVVKRAAQQKMFCVGIVYNQMLIPESIE